MKYLKHFENAFYDDPDYKYHKQVILDVFQDVIDDYNMETSIDEDFKTPPGFCFRMKPVPKGIYIKIINRDFIDYVIPMPEDVNNDIKKSIDRLKRMGYVVVGRNGRPVVNRYKTLIRVEYETSEKI